MTARSAQLALMFPLSQRSHFDSFEVGANVELVRRLQQLAAGGATQPGLAACYLHGAAGVGRTHLLQAVCHRCAAPGGAIYVPLADASLSPDSLDGLDTLALVALDDVDSWLGRPETERALLALYHGLQQQGGRLLVSARAPASELGFHYADLASRLRALPAYRVRAPDDAAKARVLSRLADERGLKLSARVLNFWLTRSSRDMASLLEELERVDEAAMAAQRQVSVALLKQALDL